MKMRNANHPGVVREITAIEMHVPPGTPTIKMMKVRDTYPDGTVYEGTQSEAGLRQWGWEVYA